LTDPKYWSVNRDAVPFSSEDIYQHNPWRAPGSAPVQDACGLAGGSYSRSAGSEAGDYTHTKFAQHGDIGTEVLKALPNYTPPTWKLVRGGGGEGERLEQRQAESDGDGDGDGILLSGEREREKRRGETGTETDGERPRSRQAKRSTRRVVLMSLKC
jgi:hypothetical protein